MKIVYEIGDPVIHGTTLNSYLKEQSKDPEFAKAYKEAKEEIEQEFKENNDGRE